MMLLECRDLNYRYPSSNNRIFKDLSFRVSGAGFHALFGPSGVGKTTLAKMIAGLVEGYAGKIETRPSTEILYTYNTERLPGWSNVASHLEQIASVEKKETIEKLVRYFQIERCLESRFSKLSLGQQNRVNLTRYLLQDFDLLIMDESLANVDEATRETIILKIKQTFPEKAFLYISHNVTEVARFCEEILVIREAGKTPQAINVTGRNQMADQRPENGDMERTMQEIVHAS